MLPDERPGMLKAFWTYARMRQDVFERRLQGAQPPWTSDPILQRYKFTNDFRAADRVSQYLIRVVQYSRAAEEAVGIGNPLAQNPDMLFRTVLFRLFNQPRTWERIIAARDGRIPTLADWSFDEYSGILAKLMADRDGETVAVYNPAYILPASQVHGYSAKHDNLLKTLDQMVAGRLFEAVMRASSLKRVYEMIRRFPLIGDFLGYQLTIDFNYTTAMDWDEDHFVIAGPGARRGLQKTFQGVPNTMPAAVTTITHLTMFQDHYLTQYGLNPIRLGGLAGRKLHLIDVQNLFCEFSKYTKVAYPELSAGIDGAANPHIKQDYKPSGDGKPIAWYFPPKWNINQYFDTVAQAR